MFEEQMAGCIAGSQFLPASGFDPGKFDLEKFLSHAGQPDREQELKDAARIQQGLMAVTMPLLPFASVAGMNLPCAEIGGDFFIALNAGESIVMAVADVSGKGIAAAVMASTLQGMMHEGLLYNVPLARIARDANEFFAAKDLGAKYATCVIVRVDPDGQLEYVNCGHIPPLVVRTGIVTPLSQSCLPIGMFQNADFQQRELSPAARRSLGSRNRWRDRCRRPGGQFFRLRQTKTVRRAGHLSGGDLRFGAALLRGPAPQRRLHNYRTAL